MTTTAADANSSSNQNLLQGLQGIPWDIAARIYGNNHASLVGLFTHWWISPSSDTRSVLESGPTFARHERGVGGGMCDALLCEGTEAVGVLEVEGNRGKETAKKIGKYFKLGGKHCNHLRFGILVLYPTTARGTGQDRTYPSPRIEKTMEEVIRVSQDNPEKAIIIVALEKSFSRQRNGVRACSEYYWGELSKVTGSLYERGSEVASYPLFSREVRGTSNGL